MERTSRISPLTTSTARPAILAWLAVGRIKTRTLKPRSSALRATAAPTKPEAPVTRTMSLMDAARPRSAARASRRLLSQEFQCGHDPKSLARHEGHEAWPLEAIVVGRQATVIFGKADRDQLAHIDIRAQLLGAAHGEIVVLLAVAHVAGDADALPDQERPHRQHFQFKPGAAPPGHVAPVPGDPIDEKQNMARFLVHHGIKGLDQFGGEITRILGRLEQAEGEERIDT